MSNRTVYFYKVELYDFDHDAELPIGRLQGLFQDIFSKNVKNNAIFLTQIGDAEPMVLDILENNGEYLFARLSRKRLNNSLQIRQYSDLSTNDVLSPDEIYDKGVELFTYCIYGYRHGILSVAKANGAPDVRAFRRILQLYHNEYYVDVINVPNQDLIQRLMEGKSPEINHISIEIPTPDAQVLEEVFDFRDTEVINSVARNTMSVVFEVKPQPRGALNQDPSLIRKIIAALQNNRQKYKKVVLAGKQDASSRQMSYDLFEEFFKYQISVPEFRQEDGRKVEIDKEEVKARYRLEMMKIYDDYKPTILNVCNRS